MEWREWQIKKTKPKLPPNYGNPGLFWSHMKIKTFSKFILPEKSLVTSAAAITPQKQEENKKARLPGALEVLGKPDTHSYFSPPKPGALRGCEGEESLA